MKTKVLLFALFVTITVTSLTSMLDPNNPPAAKTGAPGESTCAQSGCHSGGSYTGTVTLSGLPDTVTTGQAYSITLTNASNAVRAGFELTCLDANNAASGTFTNGTGTSNTTSNGRRYIRQSSPHTLSGGSTSWTFTWNAPTTVTTEQVTFYFVSLCANGNGGKTGDNVFQATHSVVLQAPVPTAIDDAQATADKLQIISTNNGRVISITLNDNAMDKAQVNLFDLNGKIVLQQALNNNTQIDLSQLPDGIYIVQVSDGKSRLSQKIVKK